MCYQILQPQHGVHVTHGYKLSTNNIEMRQTWYHCQHAWTTTKTNLKCKNQFWRMLNTSSLNHPNKVCYHTWSKIMLIDIKLDWSKYTKQPYKVTANQEQMHELGQTPSYNWTKNIVTKFPSLDFKLQLTQTYTLVAKINDFTLLTI